MTAVVTRLERTLSCRFLSLPLMPAPPRFSFFFFNDTATTEIYTLSLHDALPICQAHATRQRHHQQCNRLMHDQRVDRKSTRLNSSHLVISYAVFCLKKKKNKEIASTIQFEYVVG